METYYLGLQLAFWQFDNNMQIATVKMNMIYKTYTCQFPKDFGTPTTQGFPSHSTILAGLVAQTFQNPWRKLPWNHDHLTTDHAQAGPTRSWLQGFDDFEWFWCIVQSMCGPYYPSLVPPLDIPLPSFSLPFTSCRHLWTKKLQRPLFCTLQQRQGALLDGCQVEETSSDQGSLASAFAQDSSSKDHTHVTGRLNWWSSLLSAFVGIPKHAVSQCAVNVLVHTLFLRQFDMSKRLQDCPSVNPPHLKKVGIFEFFNGLFKRRILWNLASGNWNESDGKAEATPYHFPGPSILVCQCYHNELEVPSKCQKNWHVHCLVACFVKEGTNPMHERRSKQIMRREMIPNLWTPPTSFLLVEGFDPKAIM